MGGDGGGGAGWRGGGAESALGGERLWGQGDNRVGLI